MKLTLKNFKCYENKVFNFENGMTLLAGNSGVGKSSSFMALNFALFGTGSNVKMSGKTSCSVELEYNNLYIKRTKTPNTLFVKLKEDTFDGDAGQEIINRTFGETFDVTGYIAQNALNSFILMKPPEKLSFLETFAFKDINLESIKEKCKSTISLRNEQLKRVTTQLEMATSTLGEMVEPPEVKFPIKCSETQQEKVTKNEEIKIKNCNTLTKKSRKEILKLQAQIKDLEHHNDTQNMINELIDSASSKLSQLSAEKNLIQYDGDESLNKLSSQLEDLVLSREVISMKRKYDEDEIKLESMKSAEIEDYKLQSSKITDILWKENSKEDTKLMLEENTLLLSDLKLLKQLEKELKQLDLDKSHDITNIQSTIEEIKSKLESNSEIIKQINIQSQIYKCPVCNCSVQLEGNNLVISKSNKTTNEVDLENLKLETENIHKKLQTNEKLLITAETSLKRKVDIQNQIKKIEEQYEKDKELPSIADIREDIDYLNTYYMKQLALEKEKNDLDSKITNLTYSKTCVEFERGLRKQLQKIKSIEDNNNINLDVLQLNEETLRTHINTQQKIKQSLLEINKRIIELETTLNKYQGNLKSLTDEYITKYGLFRNIEELSKEIQIQEHHIKQNEEKRIQSENNLKQIERFNQYKIELQNYNSWKLKITKFQEEEQYLQEKYSAAMLLKEKILEAESIAMLNVIESINQHAQVYLDSFFPDHPISVRLVAFKESKKNTMKPVINLEIDYKTMECSFDSLSGGEASRIILAFTLALNEMFNSPMILLDESTASLDQEMTSIVFEIVKENFRDKHALIIAHQVTHGLFDHIIHVA
jgi:DNA repair exonuclease SbcCD ATPase subunit